MQFSESAMKTAQLETTTNNTKSEGQNNYVIYQKASNGQNNETTKITNGLNSLQHI